MEGFICSWRGHNTTIHLIGFAAMLLVKWGCWNTPSQISHQDTGLLVPFSIIKSKSMLLVGLSKTAPEDHELRLLQQFFDCHGEFQKIVAAVASRREFRRWLVPGVTFSRFEIFRLWARVIRKTYEGRRNASGRRQETNFLFVFDVMTQEQARQSALSDVSNGNRQLRFEK